MRLGSPGFLWFLICFILGALAVIAHFKQIGFVTPNRFWFAVSAWGLAFRPVVAWAADRPCAGPGRRW